MNIDVMLWRFVVLVERVRSDCLTEVRNRLAFRLQELSFGHDRVSFGLDELTFQSDNSAGNRFGGLQHRRNDGLFSAPQVERFRVVRLKIEKSTMFNMVKINNT